MSKSFARLADYLLDSYIQAALMTATELAHEVDVDAATVVRFAQSLGYTGFPDLQAEIKERVQRDLLIRPHQAAESDSIHGVVSSSMMVLKQAVEQARRLLDADTIDELAERIGKARRIIVLPESLAQAAAYNLVSLLEQGGFLASMTPPGLTDLARTISSAAKADLLLAIDVAGDAPFLPRALAEAGKRGIPTAAIVGAASHETARFADVVLAAQSQADIGLSILMVNAIGYALAQALRWKFKERYEGSSEAIESTYARLNRD